MQSQTSSTMLRCDRRRWLMLVCCALPGCSSPLFRGQRPDDSEIMEFETGTMLIGDIAVPWGTNSVKVESVALVNGLAGTGSGPPPSLYRDRLIGEMQSHRVPRPHHVLDSPETAMVLVQGYLPPGVKKGDRFDIELRTPPRSETTSLRGGWLMPSRMREMHVLGSSVHSGHVAALASGPVLVESIFFQEEAEVYEKRGRVLGGGVSTISRPLGLFVRDSYSSVRTSTRIGRAINDRFHHFEAGAKKGVATPKEDDFIELAVHPRYKHNLKRYLHVVRSIALRESAAERTERMELLKKQLHEPISSYQAALQLEGIGAPATTILKEALPSLEPQVRFHAAEALAYLDESEAADALAETAVKLPRYRRRALIALATMDHLSAYDVLIDLLHVASAETRYGAFYALRLRNPNDPMIKGDVLGSSIALHRIHSKGDPIIHFSRSKRPEVVIFARDTTIETPVFLFAGKRILVRGMEDGGVRLSHYVPGRETESETCDADLEQIIRTIAGLGGGYAEVLEAVQAAQKDGLLGRFRVVIDARPQVARRNRGGDGDDSHEAEPAAGETELEFDMGSAHDIG